MERAFPVNPEFCHRWPWIDFGCLGIQDGFEPFSEYAFDQFDDSRKFGLGRPGDHSGAGVVGFFPVLFAYPEYRSILYVEQSLDQSYGRMTLLTGVPVSR